ncbi:hypothetical protein [Phormidium tenue]|uniref:Uncharacterized protein n=1 Tax=Phormidium tenue NIES-30 TaxID=549789 RepID=A0A1U7J6Q3_9CYAN|nr:hypothetical protein [Phormidium tenue]MBD2233513.1 hypothetical protein [Phormidium tenue FACHB-1052]OKH48623.1 hypothetical protein NIES30_08710 [Phormidium tenue NIES-30]
MTQADPAPPTPSGGSNTAKWVALGCGGCLGVTVLAGLALAFFINRTMRFAIGPDQGSADSQELFTYAIPGETQSIFNMDMFGMQMLQVANTDSPPSVLLTMGQLPSYLKGNDAQQSFVEEFQNSITTQGSYKLTEQRVEERTLCDQPVSVVIQTGSFEDGPNTYNAASLLTFVEHNNDARFVWVLAHGDAPQTAADQVFATLECL